MNDKFTVINNENANQVKRERALKVAKVNELWRKQYQSAFSKALEKHKDLKNLADLPQEELMKMALAGVKFICSQRNVRRENEKLNTGYEKTLEESQLFYTFADLIFTVCGHLTLRNFVTTFPIKKTYDGAKWEIKDYFYTMEVLKEMDWDISIGREQISELLWDYWNDDLRHAYLEYSNAMSDIYRSQTGIGIMEQFFEDQGVPTYSVNNELGIMRDSQTGEIKKINKKPSYLKIVK